MAEAEGNLILAPDLYLDIPVDFQGDGLERGRVDMEAQIPPVPGLLVFAFGEEVAQVLAQAQPRPRRDQATMASGPFARSRASCVVNAGLSPCPRLPASFPFSFFPAWAPTPADQHNHLGSF